MDEMVEGIRIIAALTEDPRGELLDATKKLIKAVRDLLDAAQPGDAVCSRILQ